MAPRTLVIPANAGIDRRPDMNQCAKQGPVVEPFVALPPSPYANSNAALGTGLRRYDGLDGADQAGGCTLVIPAKARIRSAPGYEPMCAAGTAAWSKPFVALPPVERASNSNAALGTGLRRYDGLGAPIRPGGASRSSFRRTPESDRRLDMNNVPAGIGRVVEPFV